MKKAVKSFLFILLACHARSIEAVARLNIPSLRLILFVRQQGLFYVSQAKETNA